MAQSKTKAFIPLGKITRTNSKGVAESIDEYIVMPEDKAKFIGATYTTKTPAPITIKVTKGKLAGRTYTKEYAATISGTKYQLGYDGGKTGSGTKVKQKIKWVSFYLPKGVNLKLFLSLIKTKSTKAPLRLRMPSGITTAIFTSA